MSDGKNGPAAAPPVAEVAARDTAMLLLLLLLLGDTAYCLTLQMCLHACPANNPTCIHSCVRMCTKRPADDPTYCQPLT
jgi:hypothetical protein